MKLSERQRFVGYLLLALSATCLGVYLPPLITWNFYGPVAPITIVVSLIAMSFAILLLQRSIRASTSEVNYIKHGWQFRIWELFIGTAIAALFFAVFVQNHVWRYNVHGFASGFNEVKLENIRVLYNCGEHKLLGSANGFVVFSTDIPDHQYQTVILSRQGPSVSDNDASGQVYEYDHGSVRSSPIAFPILQIREYVSLQRPNFGFDDFLLYVKE